jgi:hypothetical protein
MTKEVIAILKHIHQSPSSASKYSIAKLQTVCSFAGLRKLGTKKEIVERVQRYAQRKSSISDFLKEKVLQTIATHYNLALKSVTSMSRKELYDRFIAYREKIPYKDKERCKTYLVNLQDNIVSKEEPIQNTEPYKQYMEEECGTEPVAFGSILLHSTKALSDGNCFFDSVKTCMNVVEDVQTFRKNIAAQFTLEEFMQLSQGWVALGLISEFLTEPDKIHTFEELKEAIQSLQGDKRKTCYSLLRKHQKQLQAKLAKDGTWAEEWMTAFVSKALQVNIIVYENAAKQFQMFRERMSMKPYIFLYNFSETHFEPMKDNDENYLFSEETVREGLVKHKLS